MPHTGQALAVQACRAEFSSQTPVKVGGENPTKLSSVYHTRTWHACSPHHTQLNTKQNVA